MHPPELLNYQPIAELIYSLLLALGTTVVFIHLIIDGGVSYARSPMRRGVVHAVPGPGSRTFEGLMGFPGCTFSTDRTECHADVPAPPCPGLPYLSIKKKNTFSP